MRKPCDIKALAPQGPELVFFLSNIGPHTTSVRKRKNVVVTMDISVLYSIVQSYSSVRRLKSGNVQPLSRCLAKAAFCSGTLPCQHTRRAVSNKEKPLLERKKETAVRSLNEIRTARVFLLLHQYM